jgi:hypothetical protein
MVVLKINFFAGKSVRLIEVTGSASKLTHDAPIWNRPPQVNITNVLRSAHRSAARLPAPLMLFLRLGLARSHFPTGSRTKIL